MNHLFTGLLAVGLALAQPLAHAQAAWPNKPIRAIVPFAAGSATDTVARVVFEKVSKQLGQPIIVENKAGAGGTIGSSFVAHAEPDGYTLLVHSNSHTVTPATYKNLNYDAQRDLVGVIPLASVPMVMVTSPQKGARTLQDLVNQGKAKPGSLNYASAGTGGATHLGVERLLAAAGFTATHIPTKGSAEALNEVISGRVDFYFSPVGMAMQQAKADKVVTLAVSSSKRSAALPNVPTTEEAGYPNSGYDVWIAMLAPAKTPRAIVERLNEETAAAIRSPEIKERFAKMVMDDMVMSVDQFNRFLAQDFKLNAELVKTAGIVSN